MIRASMAFGIPRRRWQAALSLSGDILAGGNNTPRNTLPPYRDAAAEKGQHGGRRVVRCVTCCPRA
ncbi:MAG: hypothetical protein LBV45_00710 [Xanthomonadaceae bacterium]|nr:hypothetical protein [Xanthomonadaceae bacterium]